MGRVIVLSERMPVNNPETLYGTEAMVVAKDCRQRLTMCASFYGLPYVGADEAFCLSPQSLRFPPTRILVRNRRKAGVELYSPLSESWLRGSNWQLARNNAPALLTAFVLAHALGAETIDYWLTDAEETVNMSFHLLQKFKEYGIAVRFIP